MRLTLIYYTDEPPGPFFNPFDTANFSDPTRRDPDYIEEHPNLRHDLLGSNYVLTTVNAASYLVKASWGLDDQPPSLPQAATFANARFQNGDEGRARPPFPTTRAALPPASLRWRRWTRSH